MGNERIMHKVCVGINRGMRSRRNPPGVGRRGILTEGKYLGCVGIKRSPCIEEVNVEEKTENMK